MSKKRERGIKEKRAAYVEILKLLLDKPLTNTGIRVKLKKKQTWQNLNKKLGWMERNQFITRGWDKRYTPNIAVLLKWILSDIKKKGIDYQHERLCNSLVIQNTLTNHIRKSGCKNLYELRRKFIGGYCRYFEDKLMSGIRNKGKIDFYYSIKLSNGKSVEMQIEKDDWLMAVTCATYAIIKIYEDEDIN